MSIENFFKTSTSIFKINNSLPWKTINYLILKISTTRATLKTKKKSYVCLLMQKNLRSRSIFVEKSIIRSEYKILNSSKKILKKPPQMFYKKGFLKHFTIFTEKHLCWPASLQLYLKETPTQVFPVNITKLSRTSILKNICERLLWKI